MEDARDGRRRADGPVDTSICDVGVGERLDGVDDASEVTIDVGAVGGEDLHRAGVQPALVVVEILQGRSNRCSRAPSPSRRASARRCETASEPPLAPLAGGSARTSVAGEQATRGDPRAEVINGLAPQGYEPVRATGEEIALANCPFHRLAEEQRELVCGMNLDLVRGVLDGLGLGDRLTAHLDPAPGYCCVRITVE